MMNTHQQTAANLENVLLRPAANSMVFKQPNAKPQLPMQPGESILSLKFNHLKWKTSQNFFNS